MGVSICISPLVTKAGHTLGDLRIRVCSQLMNTQIPDLKLEVVGIKSILENVIRILKRLLQV